MNYAIKAIIDAATFAAKSSPEYCARLFMAYLTGVFQNVGESALATAEDRAAHEALSALFAMMMGDEA